jgi:nitric-oxide synthase
MTTLDTPALGRKAIDFLSEALSETRREEEIAARTEAVLEEIARTGTWTPTTEELTIGARLAWRNSNRCIGRLFWKSLKVVDARDKSTDEEVFAALQHHLDYAFNGGEVRSVITVFRPKAIGESLGPRILNHQLVRFAGYAAQNERPPAGDPAEIDFTRYCRELGWSGNGSNFDVLPLVIRWPGRMDAWLQPKIDPRFLVAIEHPDFEWFKELGLQWYAVPIISDMLLEIGGLEFTAAPFNGWYMETEIGSRNFGDAGRFNLLPEVARRMGLDQTNRHGLWKDRALVELNRAVLYAYEKAGVTIVDHHTAAEQFVNFEQLEQRHGRELTADWSWITPPMSSSTTPVFHRLYENTVRTPNFFYQDSPLGTAPRIAAPAGCPFHAKNRV